MSKLFATTALTGILLASSVQADPVGSLGFTMAFGGGQDPQFGLSARILSSNAMNEFVGMAGVTYYFNDGNIGVDAGIGYNFDHANVGFTYDFLNGLPAFTVGFAHLEDDAPSIC